MKKFFVGSVNFLAYRRFNWIDGVMMFLAGVASEMLHGFGSPLWLTVLIVLGLMAIMAIVSVMIESLDRVFKRQAVGQQINDIINRLNQAGGDRG